MQHKMIIFDIPDGHEIDKLTIPKLSYCRNDENGVDMIISAPVKIIDCPLSEEKLEQLKWKVPAYSKEEIRYGTHRVIRDPELKRRVINATSEGGADVDGDIVIIDGVRYFVHVLADVVKEIPSTTDVEEQPWVE